MSGRLSRVVEGVTATAVVVSLIYVGREIQQNTAAVQAATGQAAYEMHQARISLYMENPALAELQVRVLSNPAQLTAADSVQWHYDLNLRLNVYEMVDANLEAGTIAEDMGEGWLAGLPEWTCLPLARSYWERRRHTYTASFTRRVENALVAQGDCS
jgi:hypothetical protein